MICKGCGRTFRIAKSKNWDEQLCNLCYLNKYGKRAGTSNGSYRAIGRKISVHGIIRGEAKGIRYQVRKAEQTPITETNIELYLKLSKIITGKELNKYCVLGGVKAMKVRYKKQVIVE